MTFLKIKRRTLLKGAACSLLSKPALAWFPHGNPVAAPGLKINYTNDSSNSWNSAPAAYTTILKKVISDLCNWIADPVTLNIQVGYGTYHGSAMTGLGETDINYAGTGTYAALLSALNAKASEDSVKTSAYSTLPGSAPGGAIVVLTSSQGAALGFSQSNPDSWHGFKTSGFDLTVLDGSAPGSGLYNLYGTQLHEITEGMGRRSLVDYYPSELMMLDLLGFSGSGTRSYSTSGTRYASWNNGATNRGTYNQSSGTGDLGDWAMSVVSPFAVDGTTGQAGNPRQQDLQMMAALGWTLTAAGKAAAGI